ncbi:putative repeat protein (TIGR02543 family) [Breznakia sp. PF5-3]|uniref:InlB B-repeat-containing protein n=1 Tax=unclassified Breznakia TaxID=2623764 RepID=UPI0024059E7B|nr:MULTISPECIES: InlB B-repeat-containing protein [unclassified Breznakia]MDF9825414.1 putative repeat protein (TIGR02543 family) [Breznakia sp. PM6-1]MDF9836292.1 putative repeat protein (TIGR02543 family) [Breznakia sp. PF5-3]MDF9838716.1 putative repeat protein (TIGR02543 family) [Breznakia sp. PFB2-8]MDF9860747.1 putative repeat protein (TIGR02543 family) [Breznakia sp. PH5-24]
MRKKRKHIFLVVTLLALTVLVGLQQSLNAQVYASDLEETDIEEVEQTPTDVEEGSPSEVEEENVETDTPSTSTMETLSTDITATMPKAARNIVSVNNYDDFINAIRNVPNGGTIIVENDIHYADGTITDAPSINDKQITIRGLNNPTTLYSDGIRHFFATGNSGLTLENIVLDGELSGGGIYSYADSFTLKGGTIKNTKNTGIGGAIRLQGTGAVKRFPFTMDGTTIINNSTSNSGSGGHGGAIGSWEEHDIIIRNSRLIDNSADLAINGQGGAIFTRMNCTLSIDNTVITGNKAVSGGGISHNSQSQLTITNSTINENVALMPTNSSTVASAGAIDHSGLLAISDSEVNNNKSYGYHAGILTSSLEMNNCKVNNNKTYHTTDSGSTSSAITTRIYYAPSNFKDGSLIIKNSEIKNNLLESNYSHETGGTIYVGGGNSSITNTTISDNIVISTGSGSATGGAIYLPEIYNDAYPKSIEIGQDTKIVNNIADKGGAIFANGSLSTIIVKDNALIEKNIATDSGGALHLYYAHATIQDKAVLSKNNGTYAGAVFMNGNGKLNFNGNVQVSENSAAFDGGAMDINSGATVNITGGTYEKNVANRDGGFIFFLGWHSGSNVTVNISGNTKIQNNNANRDGGAIYTYNDTSDALDAIFNITDNVVFQANTAGRNGGAIYLDYYKDVSKLKTSGNVLFKDNAAVEYGGAIYVDHNSPNSIVEMNNTKFENNNAGKGLFYWRLTKPKNDYETAVANHHKQNIKNVTTNVGFANPWNNYDIHSKADDIEISVIFDYNGGSLNDQTSHQTTLSLNDLLNQPEQTPTNKDKTFAGWYLKKDTFDSPWDFSINKVMTLLDTYEGIEDEPLVLYANWKDEASKPSEPTKPTTPEAPSTSPDVKESTKKTNSINTFDNTNILGLSFIVAISGLAILFIRRKKHQ